MSQGTPQRSPLVSVIVPVYNAERYLSTCLYTLVNQTLRDIEVLAIDDGSTDGSPAILGAVAAADPRVRVITKENEGYGATVNRGIAEARGAYVGIVEADDWVSLRMFKLLHRWAVRYDCDLVKCDYREEWEDRASISRNLRGFPYRRVFDTADDPRVLCVSPSPWAALYRRDMLVNRGVLCRETPGAAFQDTGLTMKALVAARRCLFLPDVLVHYRVDSVGSSSNSRDKAFAVCDEVESVRAFLAGDPLRASFEPWVNVSTWRKYAWNRARIAPGLLADFDARVRDEFMAEQEAGRLNLGLFEPDERIALQRLLEN